MSIDFEVVSEAEFPKRKRTSKYSAIIEAAANLQKGKAVKVKAGTVKIGTLRSLLQKQEGKFGVAEKDGYVYIRKK